MQEDIRLEMENCGIDVVGALNRMMGNEDLFCRMMKRFLEDESYQNLKRELANENYEEAFKYAHALKGVAGNLGLDPIMEADIIIVEKLRHQNIDGIKEDEAKLTAVYEQVCEVLKKI